LLTLAMSPATASIPPDIAACETVLARSPRGEEPALCLYRVATTGKGPSRTAAAGRLRELQEKHPNNVWFSLYLARYKWTRGEPKAAGEAERLYRYTAQLASRLGVVQAEYSARAGLIRMLQDAGNLDEALAEVERAVRLAESSGDSLLQAKAGILQSTQWTALGEMDRAYVKLRRIERSVEAERSSTLTRDHLFALGAVAQQTGRFGEAREVYGRLAALTASMGETVSEAVARYGLAAIRLDELSEMPTADGRREVLELARRALEVIRTAGLSTWEAQPLWILGSLEDETEAVPYLKRCSVVAATPGYRSYCLSALARRLADTDPGKAEEAIHEALALAQESGDVLARTSSWKEHMRVSWEIRPPGEALKDSRAALDAIEALRDLQGGSARQPGLFSTWAEDYYWLSGRLLESNELEAAFEVIERMRSRTLLDAIGLSRSESGVSPALKARRADLVLEIAQAQRRLLKTGLGEKEQESARARLGRLEIEEESLRARIDPHVARLRKPGFASLEKLRRALAPDEALLSFQIAPWEDLAGDFGGGSWLLASTRDETRVHRLPGRTELRPEINVFTGMFPARNGSEAKAASTLYKDLLGPALAKLSPGIRRLVIVPDDFVHRVPFAALRPEPGSDPLIVRYEITLAPSATLWLRWRQARPAPAVTPALIFADPESLATVKGAATERAATFIAPARLGALPFARREGKSVKRHLGGGKLLVGKEASESYFKSSEAAGFRLLHFATHVETDEVNPDRSRVYLSPGDGKEDGLLQVREIVEADLDSRIVVLSSCESGSGEILRGEGVMGLARAFFQAGAHTVVASLWRLRDDDGAALFDRFYHHIARGETVAAALRAAQRDRMEAGAPADAWAGVIVLGDGDRVPVPGGRRGFRMAWIAGVVLVAAAGAILYFQRLRRQRRKTTA